MASPLQDWEEGTGESSPPYWGLHEVKRRILERLHRTGRHEHMLARLSFPQCLARHLQRLPRRYLVDVDVDDKAEDVLLHWRILNECADPGKRPVFHARYVKSITVPADRDGGDEDRGAPCQRLMEVLSSQRRKAAEDGDSMLNSSRGDSVIPLHEIIFSTLDRPKLLSCLTALLDAVGLHIREAHLYCTVDGFCFTIFLVDGWETEETDELIAKIKETLLLKHPSSDSTNSSTSGRMLDLQKKLEILKLTGAYANEGEKIAS